MGAPCSSISHRHTHISISPTECVSLSPVLDFCWQHWPKAAPPHLIKADLTGTLRVHAIVPELWLQLFRCRYKVQTQILSCQWELHSGNLTFAELCTNGSFEAAKTPLVTRREIAFGFCSCKGGLWTRTSLFASFQLKVSSAVKKEDTICRYKVDFAAA